MDKSPLRQGEGSSASSAPNTPPLWQAQKAKGERDMLSSLCCVSRQGSGTKVPFNISLSLPGIDVMHTHMRRLDKLYFKYQPEGEIAAYLDRHWEAATGCAEALHDMCNAVCPGLPLHRLAGGWLVPALECT